EAGTVSGGQLAVNGDIHADGAQSGSGGTVVLRSNSSTVPFSIGQSTTNGVTGVVTANAGVAGGSGGPVVVSNNQGQIAMAPGQYSFDGSGGSGNGGHIELTAASVTAAPTGAVVLHASGSGTGNGGCIVVSSGTGLVLGDAEGDFSLTATSG